MEQSKSKYLNNRADNSHQPTRQRERAMQRFKSPGSARRFLSLFSMISPHFRPRRHLLGAAAYRQEMRTRLQTWREVTRDGGYRVNRGEQESYLSAVTAGKTALHLYVC